MAKAFSGRGKYDIFALNDTEPQNSRWGDVMIRFDHVSVTRENRKILKDINWHAKKGEHWAILGLNGSGKTTMLQLLNGYLWPSSGKLIVLGETFGQTAIPELRKRIGWVSSALQQQLHAHDVAEHIVLSGKFASIGVWTIPTEAEKALALELLVKCGGRELIGLRYGILSQGQQQIILIARALMAQPEILILDEPCNGLDLFAKERLLEDIQRIADDPEGPTMIYVSHHTEEILPCFKKLMLLKDGSIHKTGKTADLLQEEVLNAFYEKPVQTIRMSKNRLAVFPK
ncbi:iron complex transport system ATP-binding protein [Trichococcus ilyis]|uniref:Abc transporter n=2 Tax=Trichococcus ilyis TaxID=640938 RepID=A0A143Y973_9LACT|nr:abc transporter [Trichococcus ilyis]SEI53651.1 iron complex transport system ATP-binding protein [Trichococcus ilyis]